MDIWALFQNYTFLLVTLGVTLLGLLSGVLGTLAVLNKQALIGDGISHSALPGLVLTFMLMGVKQTLPMMLGALLSGMLAVWMVMIIVRYTKIKFDAALALILSVFFGFGLVLKTLLQRNPNARQAGIDGFLYGQASSLLRSDVELMAVACIISLLLVIVLWRAIKVTMFDREFAQSIGIPIHFINALITGLIGVAIIIGIQSVGVVLMSAMLVAPAVAARQWTSRFWLVMVWSAVFGMVAGVLGTVISSVWNGMPTGATIVLVISVIALVSLLFAPGRGILYKTMQRAKVKKDLKEGKYVPS